MTNTKSALYEYNDFNWPIIYTYIFLYIPSEEHKPKYFYTQMRQIF